MNLIEQIQAACVDREETVSNLLRRCLILSKRSGNTQLEMWVQGELNGYEEEESVPDYRITTARVVGNFVGFFGSQVTNYSVPPASLPEGVRKEAGHIEIRSPISTIERLLSSKGDVCLDGGNLPLVMNEVLERMNCVSASYHVSRTAFEGITEAVRNRVLTLSLELEAKDKPSNAEDLGQATKALLYGMIDPRPAVVPITAEDTNVPINPEGT